MIGEMADVEKSVEDTEPDGDVGGVSDKRSRGDGENRSPAAKRVEHGRGRA